MNVLITGSGGQLAREFVRLFASRSVEVAAPDERQCDITDRRAVEQVVSVIRPDVIVNCAAYNLVDRAETERDAAQRVNADGPRCLAEAARRHGSRLVHFSSDYVFDGTKADGLYTESDATSPLNEYGRSKRSGEEAVTEVLRDRSLVLRLSWVFGGGTQNFIHKFRERVERGEPLAATCDEFSVPTWTGTVAQVTLAALERGMTGLYHLTNSGYCSRFDWARAVLHALGQERFIRPVTMASFNLPAQRPMFSAMSNGALSRALDITIEPWEEAVTAFVRQGRNE
jgi:dTDP-4-dehydrorhamnose reductase